MLQGKLLLFVACLFSLLLGREIVGVLRDISLFLCTEVVHLVGAMSAEDGKLLVYKAFSRRRSRSESRDESS